MIGVGQELGELMGNVYFLGVTDTMDEHAANSMTHK
jgi:hypothetical protein